MNPTPDLPAAAKGDRGPARRATELWMRLDAGDPLEPQGGAVAADAITLRLAAEAVAAITGRSLALPATASGRAPVLESLAKVEYDPESRAITASIDTGKLGWNLEEVPTKVEFTTYSGVPKQGAELEHGWVADFDGHRVSNAEMLLPDGRPVTLWFAEVPEHVSVPNRFELVRRAGELMRGFGSAPGELKKRVIPATSVVWESDVPEVVDANPDIASVKQSIRFAVDYTGAQAKAETTVWRSNPVTFGADGPVMYWLTDVDGDTPFAPTLSKADAWLTMDQRPTFDRTDAPGNALSPRME